MEQAQHRQMFAEASVLVAAALMLHVMILCCMALLLLRLKPREAGHPRLQWHLSSHLQKRTDARMWV
jgi:hypothetical protein